jgi:hypothetical protein
MLKPANTCANTCVVNVNVNGRKTKVSLSHAQTATVTMPNGQTINCFNNIWVYNPRDSMYYEVPYEMKADKDSMLWWYQFKHRRDLWS